MPKSRMRLLAAGVALAGGCLAFGAKLALVHEYGSDVPYQDEWDAIGGALLVPRAHGQLQVGYFLKPQNEHRIVFSRLLGYSLAASNGQWDALLEMSVNAAIHASLCAAFILLARRFVAGMRFAAVAVATALLFALPFDWENTLQGLQSQFYLLEWGALGMFLLCAASRPLGARWWAGWIVGAASLGTMSSGFMAAAALLALLAVRAAVGRRLSGRDTAAAGLLAALCAAGVLSITRVPGHDVLRAHSPWDWLAAAAAALSWPDLEIPLAFAVMQLPMAVLLARRIRARTIGGDESVLFALAFWSWLQVAAIAYGRANEGMFRSPRYTDLYAVGVFANALAMALLLEKGPRLRAWGLLGAAWAAIFSLGLWTRTREAHTDFLDDYPRLKALERQHVRAFLSSGDPALLLNAPPGELPYPRAGQLCAMLGEPAIRSMLPPSIRAAVALSPQSGSGGFGAAPAFAPPPESPGRIWIARAGPARFVSQPLSRGVLPFLEVSVCGSPDLDASAFRLESDSDVRPDSPFPLHGALWHFSDLRVPRAQSVRVVVDVPPGAHWLAFAEPVEIGAGSWLDRWLLRRSKAVTVVSATLFAAALLALLSADARRREWW
ncbi:MAG TPA: hypothetical protein VKG78_10070 [Opitutaceae bacterium]|nr:hypothetical protein [Opitutaceae bacterium]